MADFDTTVHALHRWTRYRDMPHVRAAADLLIWHEGWLRRRDFTSAAVRQRGGETVINWDMAREFFESGPRGSSSELAILDLAIAIGEDRFRFGIMGSAHSKAIVRAVAQALGEAGSDGT